MGDDRNSRSATPIFGIGIDNGGFEFGSLTGESWSDPLPDCMDTIYNFGLEFTSILDRGHAAWELCIRSIGFGRQAMDCLHNKGSKATALEICEMEIHDDIVGRQYRLLRWMEMISKEDVQPYKRSIV